MGNSLLNLLLLQGKHYGWRRKCCDKVFHRKMLGACDKIRSWWSRGECKRTAAYYYAAVWSFGGFSYEEASPDWCKKDCVKRLYTPRYWKQHPPLKTAWESPRNKNKRVGLCHFQLVYTTWVYLWNTKYTSYSIFSRNDCDPAFYCYRWCIVTLKIADWA